MTVKSSKLPIFEIRDLFYPDIGIFLVARSGLAKDTAKISDIFERNPEFANAQEIKELPQDRLDRSSVHCIHLFGDAGWIVGRRLAIDSGRFFDPVGCGGHVARSSGDRLYDIQFP
jgi:hypothetical protein